MLSIPSLARLIRPTLFAGVDGSRTKNVLISSLALGTGLYFATIGGHEMNRNRQITSWVVVAFGLFGFFQLWCARYDIPPLLTFQVMPIFPRNLEAKRIKGHVLVEFVVEANGTGFEPRVVRATSPEFGEAALAAVTRWKFNPAVKRGLPVRTRMQVPIAFNLS